MADQSAQPAADVMIQTKGADQSVENLRVANVGGSYLVLDQPPTACTVHFTASLTRASLSQLGAKSRKSVEYRKQYLMVYSVPRSRSIADRISPAE